MIFFSLQLDKSLHLHKTIIMSWLSGKLFKHFKYFFYMFYIIGFNRIAALICALVFILQIIRDDNFKEKNMHKVCER